MSLPRYSEAWDGSSAAALPCGCSTTPPGHTHALPELTGLRPNNVESRSPGENADTRRVAPSGPGPLRRPDEDEALQYERLIAGQETIMGEAPPPYYVATAATAMRV